MEGFSGCLILKFREQGLYVGGIDLIVDHLGMRWASQLQGGVLQYRRCHRREVYAQICMNNMYTVWELEYSSTVSGYGLGARLGVARNHAATVSSVPAHNKRDEMVYT